MRPKNRVLWIPIVLMVLFALWTGFINPVVIKLSTGQFPVLETSVFGKNFSVSAWYNFFILILLAIIIYDWLCAIEKEQKEKITFSVVFVYMLSGLIIGAACLLLEATWPLWFMVVLAIIKSWRGMYGFEWGKYGNIFGFLAVFMVACLAGILPGFLAFLIYTLAFLLVH